MKPPLVLAALLAAVSGCIESKHEPTAGSATPARIVSLAPNLTELLYAIGAGEQLVGVSEWSDYPEEARELPVVGNAFTIDQERLALSNAELVVVWESGTPEQTIENLRRSGYRVEVVRTRGLRDVATALRRLGSLSGHEAEAERVAERYLREIDGLREKNAGSAPIRVFYQVAARPLYTINREHYLSELIALCGGSNVFAALSELAPTIDVEAVIARDPEVMLASTDAGADAFSEWLRWPEMAVNRYNNYFRLPADEAGRATTRLTVAARALCEALQEARQRRARAQTP